MRGALFGLDPVVSAKRAFDIGARRLGLRRHQIAPDPPLQALKRDPRNAHGALVIRRIVDDERLDRRKEHPRGVAHARGSRLALDADGAAQFLQDEFVPADSSPLKTPRSSSATSMARASCFSVRR